MKFLKACRWHFLWMAVLLAVAFVIHIALPTLDALPRMGAVFVIVAAVIAGRNSGTPVYQGLDHVDVIDGGGAEPDLVAEAERAERKQKAENAAERLLMHVPLWAGVGTFLWGFGDLFPWPMGR